MALPGFPVGTTWSHAWAGRLEQRTVVSQALRGNPLADPHERPVWVQLPASYDDDPGARYPVVHVAQGCTGHVCMWANRGACAHTLPEQVDALLARGDVPPVPVVHLDAWTSYGGSQFVDSPGTGDYCTDVSDDVVRFVDAEYRTVADPRSRAVAGKSSGGFAAMLLPVLRPDVFAGALATHAGDALHVVALARSRPGAPSRRRSTSRPCATSRSASRADRGPSRSRRPAPLDGGT